MTKPTPIDGKKVVKLLERMGYTHKTQKGVQIFEREGNVKNIMVPLRDWTPALLNQVLIKVSDQTGVSIDDLKKMMNEP